jgi:hypothetical protein
MKVMYYTLNIIPASFDISMLFNTVHTQAFVSFKKYMPHPLPYFKVNIYRLMPKNHIVSNFREGDTPSTWIRPWIGIFKCSSRKEKYLGSVTI